MVSQGKLREFWRRRGLGNFLLLPLAGCYWLAWHARRWGYAATGNSSKRLPVPVIIAGCLVAGGGGKTTLVHALVTGLRARNLTPGIISRGYGSKQGAPRLVPPMPDPAEVGDEPAFLATTLQVPMAVGHNRPATGRLLLERHPEVNVLISDDGLQHLALHREFEIIALSSRYDLGNRWLLPAGPLREPASRLRTVDAVVRKGKALHPGEHSLRLGHPELRDSAGAPVAVSSLAGRRVCAIAGIAEPDDFFNDVQAAQIQLAQRLPFPDHHSFKREELDELKADHVIMTSKDAIKCRRFNDSRIIEFIRQPSVDDALLNQILAHVNRFQPA